jgi:hypothetical protein
MAPPRKRKPIPGKLYDFKLRMPEDIRERIEAKAEKMGWPQNRIIVNELADHPRLEQFCELANHILDLKDAIRRNETLMARYRASIDMHDLSKELLKAVDTILATEGGAQQTAIERLRVVRNAMPQTKTT